MPETNTGGSARRSGIPQSYFDLKRLRGSVKGILDPKAANLKSMLKIFRINNGAFRLNGRGYDQRVVPGELIPSAQMKRFREQNFRGWRTQENSKYFEDILLGLGDGHRDRESLQRNIQELL